MNLHRFVRALARGHARGLAREPQLAAAYERIIREQAAKSARALVSETALTAAAQPDWQPPPEGVIFTPVGVTAVLSRQQLQAVETVMRPALEQAGIAWNPDDPRLQELLAQTGAWSGQAISDAMLPQLRQLVADAFADGLPVKDAAALIRARFAETAPWQAEMLARSNLNMLGNAGMQHAVTRYNETARASGDRQIETKTWTTAGDAAVRPSHVAASGQTVPVDQSFHVGGSLLTFPGDPGGALREVLNCRCTALYGSAPRSSLTAAAPSTEPPLPGDLDDQIAAGLDALVHVAEMSARVEHAEQERDAVRRERDELKQLLEADREEHQRVSLAEKQRTLEHIEALTARFTERKPRAVRVVRDDNGRAIGYEEETHVDQ